MIPDILKKQGGGGRVQTQIKLVARASRFSNPPDVSGGTALRISDKVGDDVGVER